MQEDRDKFSYFAPTDQQREVRQGQASRLPCPRA